MAAFVFLAFLLCGLSVARCQHADQSQSSEPDNVLADRMERVERLLLQQDRRIELLEAEKRELQTSVEVLTVENENLQDSVLEFTKKERHPQESAEDLTAKNSDLQKRLESGEQERRDLKDSLSELTRKNCDLEKRVVSGEQKIQELQFDMTPTTPRPDMSPKSELDSEQSISQSVLSSRDVFARSDDHGPLEAVVNQLSDKLTEVSADVQAMKNSHSADIQTLLNAHNTDIQALKNTNTQQDIAIQEAGSSVYVRWGQSQCASPSSLVYSGVVGGSQHSHTGAASNYLCLSLSPVLSDHPLPSAYGYLYGGEYETYDSHQNKDPVCAVCRSHHPTTIMVPGTNACLPGWTLEYSGFLMTGYYGDRAASEYICVDSALETRISGNEDQNGKLLYFTVAECGSLPCDPYTSNKIVTCAVCSK